MKRIIITVKMLFCIGFILILQACHQEFLAIKPTKSLVVPQKLEDFQGLLDNMSTVMNRGVGMHVMAGDEMFVESVNLLQYDQIDRETYLWKLPPYPDNGSYDWSDAYRSIFYANIVLEGTKKYGEGSLPWLELEAAAKFYRAWALYGLVEAFGDKYDAAKLKELKGVPVRLDPDIEVIAQRASLFDTYKQIFEDLDFAKSYLPEKIEYVTKPSKTAALALLARIYLAIEEYDKALLNAELSMKFKDDLLDYNTLNTSNTRTFPLGYLGTNPEVIFYSILTTGAYTILATTYCDTVLMEDFHNCDLRRTSFFKDLGNKRANYKGSYTGSATAFGGLATDELYLIRAECLIRLDRSAEAKPYLDKLLINRWMKNSYVPILLEGQEELLRFVLQERRKQLYLRGLRWPDLKRLNKDPRFQVTLKKRGTDGQLLELPPDDNRYVFPIPGNELEYITK